MLEKIGTAGFETLSKPDAVVLRLLDQLLATNPAPVIYEIGVGIGATTLPMAKAMNNRGQMVLFSRKNDVAALTEGLHLLGFDNIISDWGSDTKTYSGYHFELARGFVAGELPPFDLAYLDGGHVFHLDAPATAILKELCKPGGYLVFDDYFWCLGKSPTLNPATRPQTARDYDTLQIETCHVQLVCKSMMDTDHRFRHVELVGNTMVYQRR
jgi:predicted O-methyltransferase YrrM